MLQGFNNDFISLDNSNKPSIIKLRSSLGKGMQQRRLAGGGGDEGEDTGDETCPPSPDFTEFCLALGAWSPSNPLPGDPRSSPGLVESFFESLDQTVGQPAAHPPPPTAAPIPPQLLLAPPKAGDKRPLEESDDEAAPGPSWKVTKTVHAPGTQFMYPGSLQQPQASFQPSPWQPAPVDPFSLQPPSSSTAPPVAQPAPVSQPAPSTSAPSHAAGFSSAGSAASLPPPGPPGGGSGPQHPFVRLPRLEPGVKPRRFMPSAMKSPGWASRQNSHLLTTMRDMFRKPMLSQTEAENMVFYSERLAAHAFYFMQDKVEEVSPFEASGRLGRKFMFLYYLLRASQVLGQAWPSRPWWRELMDNIPHQYHFVWEHDRRASRFIVRLANDLSDAMGMIKNGVLPPPNVIIRLKRRLFCKHNSPSPFRGTTWDPWREDDEDWRGPPGTSGSL
ncbi:hypothetical protein Emed_003673 [Eimeria media]